MQSQDARLTAYQWRSGLDNSKFPAEAITGAHSFNFVHEFPQIGDFYLRLCI